MYAAEFANGKRIRLSINFSGNAAGVDRPHEQLTVSTSTRAVKEAPKLLEDGSSKKEKPTKTPSSSDAPAAIDNGVKSVKDEEAVDDDATVKTDVKAESDGPSTGVAERASPTVKDEAPPVRRKMDITMICGSPSSDDATAKSETKATESLATTMTTTTTTATAAAEKQDPPQPNGLVKSEPLQQDTSSASDAPAQPATAADDKSVESVVKPEAKEERHVKTEDASSTPTKARQQHRESAASGAKKRVLIDDDNTGSSDSDTAAGPSKTTPKAATAAAKKKPSHAKEKHISFSASPVKKKQKTQSAESLTSSAITVTITTAVEVVVAATESSVKATSITSTSSSSHGDVAAPTDAPGAAPADAVENFDINCECCLKDYDMRYLDPPLVERPAGEWRCFECLVNDARGWPRRRKPTASPTKKAEPVSEKAKSSKRSSGSSSGKRSRPSSSKSSSSKTSRSSGGSGSKRKKSSGHSSSTSKKSSSSSKRHKRKKSSSSSHSHHHRSSSSSHRRRHHHEYAKLLSAFQARNKERLAIEAFRCDDPRRHCSDVLEQPTSWRVVSSNVESLHKLIETLAGGSLEQERCAAVAVVVVHRAGGA